MTLFKKGLARRLAMGLGLAGLVSMPLSANAGAPGTPPAVGTPFVVFGGATALFNNEVIAALASMTAVYNVFQECATGAKFGTVATPNGCNLPAAVLQGGHSSIQNFIAIHGLTRACGANTPPLCYGTPVATELVYFISANGSGFGVQCSASGHSRLGVVGIAGLDGIYGDADDPIHTLPAFPVGDIIPAGWPGASATAAAIASCPGKTSAAAQLANVPAAVPPPPNVGNEYCIVDADLNNDGAIGIAGSATGAQVSGATPSGSLGATTIGSASNSPNGETSNIAEQCVAGFSDLPPLDFLDPGINSLTMGNQQEIGEQLFKVVVSSSLRPQSNGLFPTITSANKVWLSKAQLQTIFGGNTNASDACTWHDVGVVDTSAGNPNSLITVCQLQSTAGTLETFRNHFTVDKFGSHFFQPSGNAVLACQSTGENFAPELAANKTYIQGFGTTDEVNCMESLGVGTGAVGQIGYVAVGSSTTNAAFYAPVVEGIDADAYTAQQARNLAKCGLWPFVGPSVGGTGIADATGSANYMLNAVSTAGLFDYTNSPEFVSIGDGLSNGVAVAKDRVDTAWNLIFTAENNPAVAGLPLTPQTYGCEAVGLPPVAP